MVCEWCRSFTPKDRQEKNLAGHSGMVCEWCRSFTPKDRQKKEPSWTFRYGMRMVQIVYPKGQTRKEPIAWTFRYGMRMVQIVYPKGQTRKEPSWTFRYGIVNGADRLPPKDRQKKEPSLDSGCPVFLTGSNRLSSTNLVKFTSTQREWRMKPQHPEKYDNSCCYFHQ